MRNLAFAFTAFVSIVFSSSAFAQMPGDSRFDPGCNIHQGGNCGRQLDSWNNTWRRLHYPLEPGRGANGTYLPGGGYVANGRGVIGGRGGVVNGGVAQPTVTYGQPRVTSVTVTRQIYIGECHHYTTRNASGQIIAESYSSACPR